MRNNQNQSLLKYKQRSTRVAATVFLAPVIIMMLVFIVYPIMSTFNTSLYEWNGISSDKIFTGFSNWQDLFTDINFWVAFRNNLIIMICSICIQIPLGVALATFLDAGGKKLNVFKVIWFLPLLMSSVAIGFLFSYALATTGGIITTISKALGGGKIDLLGRAPQALFAVIGVIAWQYTPFYMVYFMAGYSGIDSDIYEAAIIDGATRGKYFKYVALPLLMPIVRTACILSLIGSLKYFDLIYVMTGGGPGTATELMATYMYKLSFTHFKMGYGSTVAAGMFILVTGIALIIQKLINKKEDYYG
ncbi:carbohydrate ABC transporter permease [Anaerocolumna sp. MB42-C2]|uniref:carbohydrate ABC transporter permease n=1 Tax=Anaerocolumna sp. MB42-C2 TaxID=3070997 RepID=UPI0027E1207B|nr:sugar ABC transporter permease [Anaerocolumna sp. MB42-C2]WMJ89549.1 sugar ABC transporter permease [Anaerocolumna sp. MB42-C2]